MRGRRCGLVTNHTGRARDGTATLTILTYCGANVRTLFSPEHGPRGDREGDVESSMEFGRTFHSLYGPTRRPTNAMLQNLDALIFDIQDAGARFYTYSTTLCYIVEACAENNIPLLVLDRPNPLGGENVSGPHVDEDQRSFVGYARIPIQHGLTLGELAFWHRADANLNVDIRIARVSGLTGAMKWPETGLQWHPPSPNLPDWNAVQWYPATCLLEFSGVSVGRGTDSPFALVGAPWLDSQRVIEESESWPGAARAGLELQPCDFTPGRATWESSPCHGIRLCRTSDEMNPVLAGMALLAALHRTHPREFDEEKLRAALPLLGSSQILELLKIGDITAAIEIAQRDAANFKAQRAPYLLY